MNQKSSLREVPQFVSWVLTGNICQTYAHPKLRKFASLEARHALLGAISAVSSRFLNSPSSSRTAALKPVQLAAAKSVGLTIPRTVVTNAAEDLLSLKSRWGRPLVYKVLGGVDFGFFETRKFNREKDLEDLNLLQACPVIFQEYIEGEFDLRITIVGRDCFPGRVDFVEGRHPIDSRVDPTRISRGHLSAEIAKKLGHLMDKLGLNYAAVDMRYSSKEGYTFFRTQS